ncbi:MAG: hypothetical protein PHI12_14125 [Dehalococcoidales bacterium]|nr:hypothetical protein [Dehalococcoidales bacterium]
MLVKVQFTNDNERYYTYYSVDNLKLGDEVNVPTQYGPKAARVIEINVPGAEIQKFKGGIKTIPAGSVVGHTVLKDEYGLGEPLSNIIMEAKNATAYHIKHHGKSLFSQGREGKLYMIETVPHVLVEDNGDRGLFRPVGKKVANLIFKPLFNTSFDGLIEIK